jgi:NAD(P)-dependent dehydrogenase (short-subunit alcohol dehydrogenase family)
MPAPTPAPLIDLHDRAVVVTGGTGALGTAVVAALVEAGATCHVTNWSAEELARFPFRDHERVRVTSDVDLADEREVSGFYRGLPPLYASIHVAGGFAMAPLAETTFADFERMWSMNAASAFLCCREAAARIRAGRAGGRIVNVAARPALHPVGGMCAYAASKAAVVSLTQSLAEELAPERIWVNAIVPGILDTPGNREAMPDADFSAWSPLDDVARTVAYLASPANATTRGALVPV